MDTSGTGEARLAAALAASRDAIVVLRAAPPSAEGQDFVVLAGNARADDLLGVPVGGRLRETMPAVIAEPLAQMCARTLADGEPRRDQARAGVAGGPAEWVDRDVVRLSAGEVALTLRDATAQRRDHDRLRDAAAASTAMADEQAALRRAAEAVAHAAPPESVIALVAEEAVWRMRADAAHVVRFDEQAIVTVGGFGATAPAAGTRLPREGNGSIAQVARTGRTARVDDYAALRRADPGAAGVVPGDVACSVSAPIRAGTRLWGGIVAVRLLGGSPFTEAEERRLERFAHLIGLAVINAEVHGRLRALAATDPLTGLANHRAFQDRLVQEVARARRYGQPLSLVLADLDHFKLVNDAHGHQAGDAVLAEVGRRLLASARTGDLMARVGGEEFAWLLPATDVAGAESLAERARRSVEVLPFPVVGGLTASLGVAELGADDDGQALFRNADLALIWTKVSGRNRCARHSPELARRLMLRRAELRAEGEPGRLHTIRAIAILVDASDAHRLRHSERVAGLAETIAERLGWTPHRRALLREAALVHDAGKISVPEEVLRQQGPLDAAALDRVHAHAVVGAEIASRALTPEQASWVRGHHERWDGQGYPDALAGEAIPEGARILAVADSWEAMTSPRAWRPAHPRERAVAEIRAGAGSQFWPPAASALLALAAVDPTSALDGESVAAGR
jgi:diguanylate cyclase (GGDEF)-like protein/putative nucleotidyltransferase with HDIG domain